MRGGTSKGIVFHDNHLPKDPEIRNRVILAAYGSPDPDKRQMDGMGGAVSVASKVAVISPADDAENDVMYEFGQVSIDRPIVDYKGTCGNIAAAVALFAVDEGLVKTEEPVTCVRIFQKNTANRIVAEVPVKNGVYDETGGYAIDGVPGTGGKIVIRYIEPGGSVTGKLFPSGKLIDTVEIPALGRVRMTIIDVGNPWVLVPAKDLGLKGAEIQEIEQDENIRTVLEMIRGHAAVLTGFAATPKEATKLSQAVPKIGFISGPQPYMTLKETKIDKPDIDLVTRVMTMGTLHKSMAVSCPMAIAGAAAIEGTTVYEMLGGQTGGSDTLRIGHPSGIFEVEARVEKEGNTPVLKEAAYGRTARRLMEGSVLVPDRFFI